MSSEYQPPTSPNHPTSSEQQKAEIEGRLAVFAFWKDQHNFSNEATVKFSELGLKIIVAVNGGAAVAMLAFVGHLATSYTLKVPVPPLIASLQYFVFGVISGCFAILFSYCTQYLYTHAMKFNEFPPKLAPLPMRVGQLLHILALIVAVASLMCFCAGTRAAIEAFTPLV